MNFSRLLLALFFGVLPASSAAAMEPVMHIGELAHALDRVSNTARVLYVAAHPDDENTRLLAYLANRRHVRAAYLSMTRGGGGQNLVGTEQGELLDVLRTEELLAARSLDGAEQRFSRMRDFGYSKSADETFAIWGRDESLADVVRVIRTFQPDVIVTRFDETPPNHGHHTASAILAREAFDAAADPTRFTEQGLSPWKAIRLLHNVSTWRGPPPPDALPLDVGAYDPRLGLGYGELAAISRSQHKSQGFGARGERGPLLEHFTTVAGDAPKEDILEGIASDWARFGAAGAEVDRALDRARRGLDRDHPEGALPSLFEARERLAALPASPRVDDGLHDLDAVIAAAAGLFVRATSAAPSAAPGSEVELQLELVARLPVAMELRAVQFPGDLASSDASPIAVAPRAGHTTAAGDGDGTAVAVIAKTVTESAQVLGDMAKAITGAVATGSEKARVAVGMSGGPRDQPTRGTAAAAERPTTIHSDGALAPGERRLIERTIRLPEDAAVGAPYWLERPARPGRYEVADPALIGAPRGPAALEVGVDVEVLGRRLALRTPVVHAWTDRVHGERIRPFSIVPPATVTPGREAVMLPNGRQARVALRIRAGRDSLEGTATLGLPAGWTSTPPSQTVRLARAGDEITLRFAVSAPKGAASGVEIRPSIEVDGARWSWREDVIDHPHVPMQVVLQPATLHLVPVDLALPKGRIGYVEGSGDSVADDLGHVGVDVERIDDELLRAGDLGRFAAIVVGIRAYNTRPALVASHDRLMRYVEEGGVVVVQYVTVSRWAPFDAEVGPYALEIGPGRITDEAAEMAAVRADHPLLLRPNRIGPADFEGWVQERGLYFASSWDPRYTPLLRAADPGEAPQDGGTLVARHGKGRYVYTGLAFFRQLRAGVPGAYRLFANLVSSP